MDRELLTAYIKTALRNLATPLVAWLAAKGILTESEAAGLVVMVIAALVAFAWGVIDKSDLFGRIDTALRLPAGSSKKDIDKVEAL